MSEDRYLELAPLSALDALDGEDRAAFEAHAPGCAACRAELAAHQSVVARLALALTPVPPRAALAARVLRPLQPEPAPAVRARPKLWLVPALASAAGIVLALGLVRTLGERDLARREAASGRQHAAQLEGELAQLRGELSSVRAVLAREQGLRDLVAHPDARLTKLAALPPAPGAAARVVWNPASREAWLLASGLAPAPPGKAYEVWVIGRNAPVPAGLFQVGADGKAVFRLPNVEETAEVTTFAVTLEPEPGVPAPTGPMVLAGAVS